MAIVTLLTDFGTRDGYAGVMQGVLLNINSAITGVVITHDIKPHDVTGGALTLWGTFKHFPKGTVHCAVVDPGVGTDRQAIAIQTKNYFFVGPDNGLLSWSSEEDEIVDLVTLNEKTTSCPSPSHTFHGRDIFAPAAAYLSYGVTLRELGKPCKDWKRLPTLRHTMADERIDAKIIHIDHFGNAITNVQEMDFRKFADRAGPCGWQATVKGTTFNRLATAYGSVPLGQTLIIFNSFGLLEIAANCINASEMLGLKQGDTISIEATATKAG